MRSWKSLGLLYLFIWICLSALPGWAASELQVVATFSILGDFAQKMGGDKIVLHTLVGPGGDTHTFEPSPADSVTLVKAALIFENGIGFETWLEKLYKSSGSKAKRVVVTKGLELLPAGAEHVHAQKHNQEEQREFDPHVWLDVNNVIHLVKNIRDALIQTDPANTKIYQTNAERYIAALQELDSWIVNQTQTLPEAQRKLVTTHDTFGYFAHRYGFAVVGTALGSLSTDVADPSASEIAALVEAIKETRVPAIFVETVSNPKLMERIAAEAGVQLAPPLYTDALGAPGSAGETYIKMMWYNVTTMITALKR